MQPRLRKGRIAGRKLYWLYDYNETIRSILYRFKGCGDYELKDAFFANQRWWMRLRFHGYTIVPVPSFGERDARRGFNHVRAMFSSLDLPVVDRLVKTADVKQADLHLLERRKIGRHIQLTNGPSLEGKKVLLVDDLCTTGSTIRACVSLLEKCHPKKIVVFTMGRTLRD